MNPCLLRNLGFVLLHFTSDDELFLKKGYIYNINSYFWERKDVFVAYEVL